MLLITTTRRPATDLGYLLHKNPGRAHEAELAFGRAIVAYPEASDDRCTAALILDIDPVGLVRGATNLDQYVNDRPYVASSFLSTAVSKVYGTAMSGRCKEKQELVETPIPLELRFPVVSTPSPSLVHMLFAPLGYEVDLRELPLDEKFPEWGASKYVELKLTAEKTVKEALTHVTVLIPVLDDDKHYFVGKDEVDKLLRKGQGWLDTHPHKETIARRYLRHDRSLLRLALERLEPEEREPDEAITEEKERKASLHDVRHDLVVGLVRDLKAKSVVDLGCGDGKLMAHLVKVAGLKRITGMDVSIASLERAGRRLRLDKLGPRAKERLSLLHGSLVYRDERLTGYDVACVIEVIEHLDPERLRALERTVFEFARPGAVIVTTPNREYNTVFESMQEGSMRHSDHRFEWTRGEFADWCGRVARDHCYQVNIEGAGEEHPDYGAPSQLAVFRR